MNLPKQSRPVMRDVSRDPTRAQVEPGANGGGGWVMPPINFLANCLAGCGAGAAQDMACVNFCHRYYG